MGTLGKQLESEEAKKKSEKSIRDEIGGRDVEWIEKLVAKMKSNLLKTGSAARSPETKELSKFVSSVCERMLAERIQQGIDDGLKIASLTTTTSDRKVRGVLLNCRKPSGLTKKRQAIRTSKRTIARSFTNTSTSLRRSSRRSSKSAASRPLYLLSTNALSRS